MLFRTSRSPGRRRPGKSRNTRSASARCAGHVKHARSGPVRQVPAQSGPGRSKWKSETSTQPIIESVRLPQSKRTVIGGEFRFAPKFALRDERIGLSDFESLGYHGKVEFPCCRPSPWPVNANTGSRLSATAGCCTTGLRGGDRRQSLRSPGCKSHSRHPHLHEQGRHASVRPGDRRHGRSVDFRAPPRLERDRHAPADLPAASGRERDRARPSPHCHRIRRCRRLALNQPLVCEVVIGLGLDSARKVRNPGHARTHRSARAPGAAVRCDPYVEPWRGRLRSDLDQAYMKMETVEHFARIALVTHQLGHQQPLGAAEVEKIGRGASKSTAAGGRPTAMEHERKPPPKSTSALDMPSLQRKVDALRSSPAARSSCPLLLPPQPKPQSRPEVDPQRRISHHFLIVLVEQRFRYSRSSDPRVNAYHPPRSTTRVPGSVIDTRVPRNPSPDAARRSFRPDSLPTACQNNSAAGSRSA